MNAISLLKNDHRTVEELFDKLDQLDGKPRGKKQLVEKIVRELSIHSAIEEQIFYPEVKKGIPDTSELVLESLEEHNVVKWELAALDGMKPEDERFDAKLKVLKDAFLHHVDEEENELFPRISEAFESAKLNQLGASLERAKKNAPTRPHPRAPDEPPANVVASRSVAPIDRARDTARELVRAGTKRAGAKHRKSAGARAGRAAH